MTGPSAGYIPSVDKPARRLQKEKDKQAGDLVQDAIINFEGNIENYKKLVNI